MFFANILLMNWYYHKKIGLDMIAFWREMIQFVPASLLAALFGWGYSALVRVQGWTMLLISAAVYTVAYALIMWLLGMNEYEKQLVRKILHKLPGVK